MTRVLLCGNGSGRDVAIATSLRKNSTVRLFCALENTNDLLMSYAEATLVCGPKDLDRILSFARRNEVTLALVDDISHLGTELVSLLREAGIRTFGPSSRASKVEHDKFFFDQLIRTIIKDSSYEGIIHIPRTQVFASTNDALTFLEQNPTFKVIKPRIVTSGNSKDVEFAGHGSLRTPKAVRRHLDQLLERLLPVCDKPLLLQEYVDPGTAFLELGFQILRANGHQVVLPIVRDYKRVRAGNRGMNSPGVLAVTAYDSKTQQHTVPDLRSLELQEQIRGFCEAFPSMLEQQLGEPYEGVLYLQFIVERDSRRVFALECNTRFGDPESIVTLSIVKDSLYDLIEQLYQGKNPSLQLEPFSAIVSYLLPDDYPNAVDSRKSQIQIPRRLRGDQIVEYPAIIQYKRQQQSHDYRTFICLSDRALALLVHARELTEARRTLNEFLQDHCVMQKIEYRTDY